MKYIERRPQFIKHYKKRIAFNAKMDQQFDERLELFIKHRQDPLLQNHVLKGDKLGLRAFSVTGDIRVVYKETDDAYIFLDIGSHNQVY